MLRAVAVREAALVHFRARAEEGGPPPHAQRRVPQVGWRKSGGGKNGASNGGEAAERAAAEAGVDADKALVDTLVDASVAVVAAVAWWREARARPPHGGKAAERREEVDKTTGALLGAPFLWRGVDYLVKMRGDLGGDLEALSQGPRTRKGCQALVMSPAVHRRAPLPQSAVAVLFPSRIAGHRCTNGQKSRARGAELQPGHRDPG